jgi:hypothetical protein
MRAMRRHRKTQTRWILSLPKVLKVTDHMWIVKEGFSFRMKVFSHDRVKM